MDCNTLDAAVVIGDVRPNVDRPSETNVGEISLWSCGRDILPVLKRNRAIGFAIVNPVFSHCRRVNIL